jgi:hypothetical protein
MAHGGASTGQNARIARRLGNHHGSLQALSAGAKPCASTAERFRLWWRCAPMTPANARANSPSSPFPLDNVRHRLGRPFLVVTHAAVGQRGALESPDARADDAPTTIRIRFGGSGAVA